MIKEDFVSLEVAKLLKEKGFDWECEHVIWDGADDNYENYDKAIPDPSHQMAMKWLREVHNIMVSPYTISLGYYFEIFDLTNRDITGCKPLYKVGIPNKEDVLPTYEQSAEVGIMYCLENLI